MTAPLPSYARGFKSMFAKDNFNILPEYHHWNHAIELLLGSKSRSTKVYSFSSVEQKELNAFLKENLHTEWICLSELPIATPVFFIKKKNGSFWLVQDYQALNSMIVKNKYLLPSLYPSSTKPSTLPSWMSVRVLTTCVSSLEMSGKCHDMAKMTKSLFIFFFFFFSF